MAEALLVAWIRSCALVYGVDPEFAVAVAHVESRVPGQYLRVGRLGRSRYFGPFGIHQDFRKKWPVEDPWVNCLIGVRALRGRDKRKVLRRYNAEFNESYYRAVMRAAGKRNRKREVLLVSPHCPKLGR